MGSLPKIFQQATAVVREGGNGRITRTDSDYIRVDYDNERDMINDAQTLNHIGFVTRLNRKMFEMTVSIN